MSPNSPLTICTTSTPDPVSDTGVDEDHGNPLRDEPQSSHNKTSNKKTYRSDKQFELDEEKPTTDPSNDADLPQPAPSTEEKPSTAKGQEQPSAEQTERHSYYSVPKGEIAREVAEKFGFGHFESRDACIVDSYGAEVSI
jgi:hypothetical protein